MQMQWTAALPYRTMHDHRTAQNLAEPRNQITPSNPGSESLPDKVPASFTQQSIQPGRWAASQFDPFQPQKRINQQLNTQAPPHHKKPASQNSS